MVVPLRDGSDYEIPEDFIAELNTVFYGVDTELYRMRIWCLANPSRQKTRRGAKRFVFNWINKACAVKQKAAARTLPVMDKPAEPLEVRQENLAKLKRALA
jgi:hypothetical protein